MTTLQTIANTYVNNGWAITSISDQQLVLAKKAPASALTILLAILFFPIGLLLFLIPRETQSIMVTAEQADSHIQNLSANAERKVISAEEIKKNRMKLKHVLVVIALVALICVLVNLGVN